MINKQLIEFYKLLDEIATKADQAVCLHGFLAVPDNDLQNALENVQKAINLHFASFEISAKQITEGNQ